MTTLPARKLNLNDVHRLLNLVEIYDDISLTDFFLLVPLTADEKSELSQIRDDFRPYITGAKASEGQVKALTTFPLLRLAGFYRYPIQLKLEEGIDNIAIEDEDKRNSYRFGDW